MKRHKVLVVDDEKVVLVGIKGQLEEEGYDVSTFSDGRRAAEAAKKENFSLALVDLWMPDVDGVKTCKLIKKHSPQTEIVLISGRPDGLSGREGDFIKAGGLDFFLYKPFMEGEILEVIRKVLNHSVPKTIQQKGASEK